MKQRFTALLLTLALATVSPLALAGGIIQGEASNALTKVPAAGVRITLTGPELDAPRSMATDAAGTYRFADLPAGTYAVTAESSEQYRQFSRANLRLRADRSLRINLELLPVRLPGEIESVRVVAGDVVLLLLGGGSRTLNASHDAREAALSPDEHLVAYVREAGKDHVEGTGDELWLADSEGKSPPRRLLAPQPAEDPKANLTGFNNPVFSPDGRLIYVLTQAWVTSNAVHQVDTNSGATRYITDANSVAVVPKGRYAGHLVVQKHKHFKQGGSREAFWLVTPDGQELRELNEIDAAVAAIAGLD
jgi:hypothetical protein